MVHDLNYDLLGLMPCPVKVPLEQKISEYAQRVQRESGVRLRYQVYSNAVMQEDVFAQIDKVESESDLPGIMIAPGFGTFFRPGFTRKFRDTGTFESVFSGPPSAIFTGAGILDATGNYDIIAFNPLVFLVNKTACPGLPTPHSWPDLCDAIYEDKVAVRGHNDTDICEAVLFTLYKAGGEEALRDLGRSCCMRLHPSQMVKMAKYHAPEAPAVSVLPYSFAHLVQDDHDLEIIWPDDGAIVNPVVMVTKKNASDAVRSLARFFVEPEGAQVFESTGFCSVNPQMQGILPDTARFNWIGWNFLSSYDIRAFSDELNDIVAQVFHARKGLPPRSEMVAQRNAMLAARRDKQHFAGGCDDGDGGVGDPCGENARQWGLK